MHRIGIILTSVDHASTAKSLARDMVEQGLAACVQISARGESVYRWQGATESSNEYFLTIKTSESRTDALIRWLEQHHPYDTPEIITLVGTASEAYAAWLNASLGETEAVTENADA